ncbi:peptidylprolyl isomerase [Kribbella deserti]|uniref:Peptidylprolyl isomerase n=1 Tax=Kribbella deserti TaxID=1926257 RepID=A0ABV6QRV8_9ACTN
MVNKTHQKQVEQRRAARRAAREAERAAQRRRLAVTITAIVAVLAVVGGVFLVIGLGGDDDAPAANPSTSPSAPVSTGPASAENRATSIPAALFPAPKRVTPLPAEVDCTYNKGAEPASKPVDAPANGKTPATGTTPVTLATTIGDLKFTIDKAAGPCAAKSFLSLVGQKYYDNTECHRMTVGKGLQVLQCGDPTGQGSGGPGYAFQEEAWKELKYGRGTLAMAKTQAAASTGSQFFIVYGDGSGLTPDYTAFGTVDAASLKKIDAVALKGVTPVNGPGDGKPITPVKITSATAAS